MTCTFADNVTKDAIEVRPSATRSVAAASLGTVLAITAILLVVLRRLRQR